MTATLPNKRPNCNQILDKKKSWALIEEEFKINDELKKELILKLDDENQIIFSLLKPKLKSRVREKIELFDKLKLKY
jgi:hypothetical protein